MADRKRSSDGKRDTDRVDDSAAGGEQQGREGGRLARDVGTRDALKRATKGGREPTRVRKSDEAED